MENKELQGKLRSLFCAGNIITVTWDVVSNGSKILK